MKRQGWLKVYGRCEGLERIYRRAPQEQLSWEKPLIFDAKKPVTQELEEERLVWLRCCGDVLSSG